MRQSILFIVVLLLAVYVQAQNVAITDDDGYSADNSAMLDIKSTTKGVLVPRVTTIQRNLINTPAKGLLVFDTDVNAFFFFNGTIWVDLSTSLDSPWLANSSGIYIADTTLNMGIGTTSADGKFEVRGDGNGGSGELLFAVRNSNGDTVFAVYDGGVRIYVDETAKGVRGGFAVGGYGGAKGTTEYLRVTPDSVRIYVNESTDKGVRGGFAVGGYGGAKGEVNELLRVTPDSVRIYVNESTAKGVRGGFAVGGYGGAKSVGNEFLRVSPDSVRVYVDETAKGVRGGFAVGGYGGAKGEVASYMQIDKDNYFIGLGAGASNEIGLYNSFLGYNAGYSNVLGNSNIFLGYHSGYMNTGGKAFKEGSYNIFLGDSSGYSNTTGYHNVFIGYGSGKSISDTNNIMIGFEAGKDATRGTCNVILGNRAGFFNNGNYNVFIGYETGLNNVGDISDSRTSHYNTFIGYQAGRENTTGWHNLSIGYQAGMSNHEATNELFIGNGAGKSLTTGYGNTYIGHGAGENSTNCQNNTFLGYYSGNDNTTGGDNVLIGYAAGAKITSSKNNVIIGSVAGYKLTTGEGNVFIGYGAGYNELGSDKLYIDNSSTSTPLIYGDFSANQMVVNGNNSNGYTFYVNGTAGGNEAWNNSSDRRLKKNIETIPNALDRVLLLRGVNYEWKDSLNRGKGMKMGFIAQEAKEVIPEVVFGSDSTRYSMQYAPITAILVEAVKELKKQLDEQADIISAQQNRIDSLSVEVANKQTDIDKLKVSIQEISSLKKQIEEIQELLNIRASKDR